MIDLDFKFSAELWEYSGKGTWHFVTVPEEISADIKAFTKHVTKGFKSVRVSVSIGESHWQTSLFLSKEKGAYILPVKAAVRKAENLAEGDMAGVRIAVAI